MFYLRFSSASYCRNKIKTKQDKQNKKPREYNTQCIANKQLLHFTAIFISSPVIFCPIALINFHLTIHPSVRSHRRRRKIFIIDFVHLLRYPNPLQSTLNCPATPIYVLPYFNPRDVIQLYIILYMCKRT